MNSQYEKKYIIAVLLLCSIALSGCWKKKQKSAAKGKKVAYAEPSIPLARGKGVPSRELKELNEELEAFVLEDDGEIIRVGSKSGNIQLADAESTKQAPLSWQEDESATKEFKNVYFDFDRHELRSDQNVSVEYDVQRAKHATEEGKTVCVSGHCDAIGTGAYNLALSEKRANVMKDRLIEQGIPENKVKAVGFGKERLVENVSGKCQANRRDEIEVVQV